MKLLANMQISDFRKSRFHIIHPKIFYPIVICVTFAARFGDKPYEEN
jgi:hypothetical protein